MAGQRFQIGEPVQFAGRQPQPIGQLSGGSDGWKFPRRGRPHRRHLRRRHQPLCYRQFVAVFRPSAAKAVVVPQKPDHLAVSRTDNGSGGLHKSTNEWAKPAPTPAESDGATFDRRVHGPVAGQQGGCQGVEKRRVGHNKTATEYSNESHPA